MATTGAGSVLKARMRISPPQPGQRRGRDLVDAGDEVPLPCCNSAPWLECRFSDRSFDVLVERANRQQNPT
jgi:hypothetical protein